MTKRFDVGDVYIATPALEGARRRIAVVIGREGAAMELAFVDELALARVRVVDGREIAECNTDVGFYSMSCVVRAAACDAAIIKDILGQAKHKKED